LVRKKSQQRQQKQQQSIKVDDMGAGFPTDATTIEKEMKRWALVYYMQGENK
jgi:hypothetical protein